jgi:ribosomal protein S18 acetylase RimI-like enzyme
MNEAISVREATCADAGAIAAVHVASWRTTYRGLMPDSVLDGLSVERRREFWEGILCRGSAPTRVFVAETPDSVVGFASAGAPQVAEEAPGYDAELYTIYLLQADQGRGTGRRLMRAAAERLLADGHRRMLLWVLATNEPSRRFYERFGGTPIMWKPYERGGATLEEVAYGYDLPALVASLEER